MKKTLFKITVSTAAAFSLFGCSSSSSGDLNDDICNGDGYNTEMQACLGGNELVDACDNHLHNAVIHAKDTSYVCRGDNSWKEASKNEAFFELGCGENNENEILKYGYSKVVCIQDTSRTWKWVVDSEVEASRLKSSSSSAKVDDGEETSVDSSSASDEKLESSSSAVHDRVEGTVEYDGYTYKTVGIGTQMWMAENLRTTTGIDSSWCFNDMPENCEIYGNLYTWATAMGIDEKYQTQSALKDGVISDTSYNRGICPKGWHIPSDAEWQTLFDFVDASNGIATAGQSLCDPNGAWKGYDNYPMTDDYGFSAIPGGKYQYSLENNSNEGWKNFGESLHVWSATESVDTTATNVYTRYIQPTQIDRNDFPKMRRRYVRCVKDE